jgi:hypothetical protein
MLIECVSTWELCDRGRKADGCSTIHLPNLGKTAEFVGYSMLFPLLCLQIKSCSAGSIGRVQDSFRAMHVTFNRFCFSGVCPAETT